MSVTPGQILRHETILLQVLLKICLTGESKNDSLRCGTQHMQRKYLGQPYLESGSEAEDLNKKALLPFLRHEKAQTPFLRDEAVPSQQGPQWPGGGSHMCALTPGASLCFSVFPPHCKTPPPCLIPVAEPAFWCRCAGGSLRARAGRLPCPFDG